MTEPSSGSTTRSSQCARGAKTIAFVEDNEWLKWGPAEALNWFDFFFVFNYAIGWCLTARYHPEVIHDNNVLRVFGVYNICIGVDFVPARPIAALIFAVSFMFFAMASYMHWVKIYFDGARNHIPLRLVSVWLVMSCVLTLTFGLTYAVPPRNALDTKIHVFAFCTGLLGYAMLKMFAAYECWVFFDWTRTKDRLYFLSTVFQALVMFVSASFLLHTLLTEDIDALVVDMGQDLPRHPPAPPHGLFDKKGWALMFVSVVSPPLQWCLVPEELRNTAHIIDATQDMKPYDKLSQREVDAADSSQPSSAR